MKKTLAILVALMMVFALLPAMVFAAPGTLTVGSGGDYATIQGAIAAIAGESGIGTWTVNIKAGTYDENVKILQQVGKNIELIGEPGVIMQGIIQIDGNGRSTGTETLLIKNIAFDQTGITVSPTKYLITLTKFDSPSYSYTHNVTIENCSFIGDSSGTNTIGIQAGSSGGNTAYNTTIKNCNFKSLHSAVQARSQGLTIEGCTTENMAEGGVNTQNSTGVTILNSKISGGKYGLRMGPDVAAGTVTITNSEIGGGTEGAIYLRTTTTANLVITGSDILGDIVSDTTTGVSLTADDVFFGGAITGIVDPTITGSRGSTKVTAKADVAYTVIIPASVDFRPITRTSGLIEQDFTVSVKDALVEKGSIITVTNTTTKKDMKMYSTPTGGELAFDLVLNAFKFKAVDLTGGEKDITTKISCDPSNLEFAGSYKGYMTFSVNYTKP